MAAMRSLTILALLAALAACSTPQGGYTVLMGVRKQECLKLPDLAERARCEKEAERSYERYKAEADAAKRGQ